MPLQTQPIPQGTTLGAPVVPGSATNVYPTHFDFYGAGGFRTVYSFQERDETPIDADAGLHPDLLGSGRRRVGMVVCVAVDAEYPATWIYYRLLMPVGFLVLNDAGKLAALANNTNWYVWDIGTPSTPPFQSYTVRTYADVYNAASDGALGPVYTGVRISNRRATSTGGNLNGDDVLVLITSGYGVAEREAYTTTPGLDDAPKIPVFYDLATDTVTARTAAGGQFWAGLERTAGDATTIAQYLTNQLAAYAPLAGATFTGGVFGLTPATSSNGTQYATTAFVRAAMLAYGGPTGGELYLGMWNPNINRAAGTGYAIDDASNTRGSVYQISEDAVVFTTTTIAATNNDTYISLTSLAGIGYGHTVTGPGVPANTRVVQVGPGPYTVVLSRTVTVANNATLTFTPTLGGLTGFKAGDFVHNGGPFGWYLTPGMTHVSGTGVVVRTGNVLVLDAQAEYNYISSGTFTVSTAGAVVGAVVSVTLGASASMPTLPAGFIVPPTGGAIVAGKEHRIMFNVMADLRVITTITPLS